MHKNNNNLIKNNLSLLIHQSRRQNWHLWNQMKLTWCLLPRRRGLWYFHPRCRLSLMTGNKVENVSSTAPRPVWGLVRKAVRPLIPVQTTLEALQRHTAMSLLTVKSQASTWEGGPALTRRAPGTKRQQDATLSEAGTKFPKERMAMRNRKKTLVNEIASSQWSRSSRCCLNNQK